MNGLDRESLEKVREWAERHVAQYEWRQRIKPLHEAMSLNVVSLVSGEGTAELLAAPRAQSRRAVANMEASLRESEERERTELQRRNDSLDRMKRRTALLRDWLEALA